MSAPVTVLGLDPGSRVTGYGLIREEGGQPRLLKAGAIRTDSSAEWWVRLGQIFKGVEALILEYEPLESAMEEVFVAVNTSSALKLGQARGAAVAACAAHGVPVIGYEPTKVKKNLVGVGRAEKSQVAFMVGRILGVKPDWSSDAADALGLALCHLNMRRIKARIPLDG